MHPNENHYDAEHDNGDDHNHEDKVHIEDRANFTVLVRVVKALFSRAMTAAYDRCR